MAHLKIVNCNNCPETYCSVCVDKCPKCNSAYTNDETLIQIYSKIRNYGACKENKENHSSVDVLLENTEKDRNAHDLLHTLKLFNRIFELNKKLPKKHSDKKPTKQEALKITTKLFRIAKLMLQNQ